jgi:hypothetical protein
LVEVASIPTALNREVGKEPFTAWLRRGIRHDPYILAYPIIPEVEKGPGQLVNKNQYLFPQFYAPTTQ